MSMFLDIFKSVKIDDIYKAFENGKTNNDIKLIEKGHRCVDFLSVQSIGLIDHLYMTLLLVVNHGQ